MATDPNEEGTISVTGVIPASSTSYIEALLSGQTYKWGGALGAGVTITYSFPGNFTNDPPYWSPDYSDEDENLAVSYLNAGQAAAFSDALQAWADVANLTFNQVDDSLGSSTTVGVIRAAFFNNMTDASGWATYPTYWAEGGDVWLNPDSGIWSGADLAAGGAGFSTMLHEIGHALGLSHPLDGGTTPGYDLRTTIMSYNIGPHGWFREVTETSPGSFSWTYTPVEPETPMIKDIAAIQYLYGANTSFQTGDNLYTFGTSTPFLKTIWDAGGEDTISVANFTRGCEIDLVPGHLSSISIPSDELPPFATEDDPGSVYDGTDNLGIAFGTIIENAIGGSGPDRLVGNSAANDLTGNAGNDTLIGGAGSDILTGGNGNDSLNGGAGSDTLTGGAGNDTYIVTAGDTIVEATSAGMDTVQSSVTTTLGAELENLVLTGTAAINGTGNELNNSITGNAGNNILNGGTGNDTLSGGAGNDTFIINGGDTVVEAANQGTDTVQASVSFVLGANVEKLTLTGVGNLVGNGNGLGNLIIGNTGKNTINGGTGNDILAGGAGNDVLIGGPGADSLNGGPGADAFLFSTALGVSNVDTLNAFSHTDDVIRLDDDIFTAIGLAPNTVLTAAKYKENATGVATDSSDRIVYNTTTGALFYDADGNGPGVAVRFAVIAGGPDDVDQTDFFVVG
ncbi:MAG: matrixin family metalloprotease [Gammaproteobacteria bacterium]|nr:matrixin family metalloprotease [Gammaproteobacteria bacterium]